MFRSIIYMKQAEDLLGTVSFSLVKEGPFQKMCSSAPRWVMDAECAATHIGVEFISNFVRVYLCFRGVCSFRLAHLPAIWEIVMLCAFWKN